MPKIAQVVRYRCLLIQAPNPQEVSMSDACATSIKMAEAEIRAILLALDAELAKHGDTIEAVRVDIRSFANMQVEVSTTKL
jgi:hypothetical protein